MSTRKPLTEVYAPADFADLKTVQDFMGSGWNKMEREISALWFLRYCQAMGEWGPFKRVEFNAWYNKANGETFWDNGLFTDEHGIHRTQTELVVLEQFVVNLIQLQPKKASKPIEQFKRDTLKLLNHHSQ